MPALNYKHLRYFWMVAKSGSIARASEQLHLTPQSISGQLSEFEEALGVKLFRRVGRGLELTETGQRMLGYAEQIFTLGNELVESLRDGALPQSVPFRVGIADSVPKMVAYRLVEPSLEGDEHTKLICREGRLATLLADLAVHRLDMVIADRPMPDHLNVRGYDHFLGESGVSIFVARKLASSTTASFPQLLDGAPFLMPGTEVALYARLQRWFESERLRPRIEVNSTTARCSKPLVRQGQGTLPRRRRSTITSSVTMRWKSSEESTRCGNRSMRLPTSAS